MAAIARLLLICFLACPSAGMAASLFTGTGGVLDRTSDVRATVPGAAHASLWQPISPRAKEPVPDVAPQVNPRGRHLGLYRKEAKRQARAFGIPEALFLALIQQESGWDRDALSPVGAIGLAQLMPGTAREMGVDPHDPVQNLHGGAKYLRAQYDTFGTWRLALAAYNAGPGAVRKHGGVPPYKETRNYVTRILGR